MFCPVCNGMQPLQVKCSSCDRQVEDWGRLIDWTGPYAPYEPVEVADELYNQLASTENCKHIAFCLNCAQTMEIAVAEWL